MESYIVRKLVGDDDLYLYYLLYRDCFPNDHDWGSEILSNWVNSQKDSHIFGLFENADLIGFRHVWCIKDYPICSVPYAGMKSGYRGKGIYPWFSLETEKN